MELQWTVVPADKAIQLLRAATAPDRMQVRGKLCISDILARGLGTGIKVDHLEFGAARWPEDIEVGLLDISRQPQITFIPSSLHAHVILANGSGLTALPAPFRCFELHASDTAISSVPEGLVVESRLVLSGCEQLTSLPDGFKVGSLNLSRCTRLTSLPEGLDVWFLDLAGCTGLTRWPRQATIHSGRLNLRGCTGITHLPDYLGRLAALDVGGCTNLTELPEGLQITGWLDLAGSGLRYLPDSLACVSLRWRGVPVDGRIAFDPGSITVDEVLAEPNAERRRVMLERVGYEKFFAEADPRILDLDRDPGGPRRLLRIPMQGDEDLVCLEVNCPSTARKYLIRVPPTLATCHQAAAWVAGFDDPDLYQPLIET